MGLIDRLRRLPDWCGRNKKNIALFSFTMASWVTVAYSIKIVPAGHVVVKEDIFGNVGDGIYADNQLVLKIPFYQKGVTVRTLPVKKRFIKEYITKDNRHVEVRVLTRMQPKIHWIPEIYRNFGKDYGRGFLEKEGTHDVSEVCKDFLYDELVNDEIVSESAAVPFYSNQFFQKSTSEFESMIP